MNENVLAKLKILAESAKYDVSCSSSGTVRSNKPGMLGNTVGGWGICHSFAEDGRCISLLKIMLTNYCRLPNMKLRTTPTSEMMLSSRAFRLILLLMMEV